MSWFKTLWDWIRGVAKTLLSAVCEAVVAKAKELAEDKELVSLALDAVQAAAREGLTGEKAWAAARNRFTIALREAGRELGDCAIDTALQTVYSAWKSRAKETDNH